MKFAYADPPYFGLAEKFYGDPTYDSLDAHVALIARLSADYEAWAMSLHTPTLRTILPLCPDDVRVGAWVKPFASFKPNVNPAYAWEPVIFKSGRRRDISELTVRDWCAVPITLRRGFCGAKPDAFSFWIFDLLGARHDDDFTDIFIGSGAVTRAWDAWKRQTRIFANTSTDSIG